jgi:hypothetical protein
MRPRRSPSTSSRPSAGDDHDPAAGFAGVGTPAAGHAPQAAPTPDDRDAPSIVFSVELAVPDHARLAEQLADHIGTLREARLRHGDVAAAREGLHAFLADDLVPYLHDEEAAFYSGSGRSGWRGTRARRRAGRRLRDHRRIVTAADAVRSARSAPLALDRAERLRALFDEHLSREDRELITADRSMVVGERHPEWSAVLATELQEVHARDHARIARAIADASRATDVLDQRDACDHAAAGLAQHAAVMSTLAYPMARRLLPGAAEATIRWMRGDLRRAERALRHLNRTLRGAAGEDLHDVERLWVEVAQAWQRHIADEEPLVRRLAPLLRPEQALTLIALLRRPVRQSLTRPHPNLLRGGWTTRMAIHAQVRIDQWRDVLDNRESLRIGD